MATFQYTAINSRGQRVTGRESAPDRAALVRALSKRDLRVISAQGEQGPARAPTSSNSGSSKQQDGKAAATASRAASPGSGLLRQSKRPLREKSRLQFLQMFRRLLGGGLSTGDAVRAILNTTGDPEVRTLAQNLWQELAEGRSFSQSLEIAGAGLSRELLELVAAGEATGRLAPVIDDVTQILEDRRRIRELLVSKLGYPVFLISVAFAVCAFLVLFLVPQVQGILTSLRVDMSWPVRVLFAFSQSIFWVGPLLVFILVAGVVFIGVSRQRDAGRLWQDRLIFQLPVFRSISRPYVGYRLCRTLASLIRNGVDLSEALVLAGRTIGNRHIQECFDRARRAINDGQNVALALGEEELLDRLSLGVLATHESIGELGPGFDDIANDYQNVLDRNLNRLIKVTAGAALGFAFSLVALVALGMVSAVFEVGGAIR